MKQLLSTRTLIITFGLALASCGEVDITNLDPNQFPQSDDTNTIISYNADLIPQFQSGCSCHSNGQSLGNLRLDLHSSATGNIDGQSTSRVDLNSPVDSHLLTYPNDGSHSGPSLPSSSQLYQDMLSWINDSALNN